MHLALIALLLFLTSCMRERLSVHTDYLSIENLASYHVGTPDPVLNNPPIGQRLIVAWSVPRSYMDLADLHILITMRFRDRKERVEKIELLKKSGVYTYSMLNEEYFDKGGILTYKVQLFGGGQVLDEWRHQLWVDLITFERE